MSENREEQAHHADSFELSPELQRIGEAVARMPRSQPPADLNRRTLERAEKSLREAPPPSRSIEFRLRWWRREITNPFARLAAMLALLVVLGLITNLDTAERLGKFTERLLGTRTTDHIETLVDRMLLTFGPVEVNPQDVERLAGSQLAPSNSLRPGPYPSPRSKRSSMLEPHEEGSA